MTKHSLLTMTILIIGPIILLSSCIYTKQFFANYTIQNTNSSTKTKELATNFITAFAENYELTVDKKYFGTDTLGFYGDPYDYFKFWFEQNENKTTINLDYSEWYSNEKKQPYTALLTRLTDSIRTHFNLIDKTIVQK